MADKELADILARAQEAQTFLITMMTTHGFGKANDAITEMCRRLEQLEEGRAVVLDNSALIRSERDTLLERVNELSHALVAEKNATAFYGKSKDLADANRALSDKVGRLESQVAELRLKLEGERHISGGLRHARDETIKAISEALGEGGFNYSERAVRLAAARVVAHNTKLQGALAVAENDLSESVMKTAAVVTERDRLSRTLNRVKAAVLAHGRDLWNVANNVPTIFRGAILASRNQLEADVEMAAWKDAKCPKCGEPLAGGHHNADDIPSPL
jgi:hypothetical protein